MPLRTLIVDDEQSTPRALARALRGIDVEVLVAHSLAEGLAVARRERPDAILTDLDLGDGLGTDLLTTLQREGIAVRGVILTARAGFVAPEALCDVPVLFKPCPIGRIVAALHGRGP
jgi:ActR/RegA family two-component response regulator